MAKKTFVDGLNAMAVIFAQNIINRGILLGEAANIANECLDLAKRQMEDPSTIVIKEKDDALRS